MIYLLDVNVLIAIVDSGHVHHQRAFVWFSDTARNGWATCPLTENGLIRILSNPRYVNSLGSVPPAAALLERLRQSPTHQFWPDEISLLDRGIFNIGAMRASQDITDIYLLGLAKSRSACLATFDRNIPADAVIDGKGSLLIL